MPALRDHGTFEIATLETSAGPLMVPYEVRRSPRARRIRLSVGAHNQALLVIPLRANAEHAVNFLRNQADWLVRQLRAAPPPAKLDAHLGRHPRLSGLGREFSVTLNFTTARPFFVHGEKSGEAVLQFPAGAGADGALKGLLRQFAETVVPPRVHELARRQNLRVNRVSLRDQGSRWGSCSGQGTVSLNWRLVLLPAAVHDHVILHELAHLTQMNHSPKFWSLLEQYDPRAAVHDRQLTRESKVLMRLGRH